MASGNEWQTTYRNNCGGAEAARADFEQKVCTSAIEARFSCDVTTVRCNQGDGGVDFLRRDGGRLHAYQAKYWDGTFGPSQKSQIQKSVKTAAERWVGEGKLASYTVIVSVTFNQDDHVWWQRQVKRWKKRHEFSVELIDGLGLIRIGERHHLVPGWFRADPKSIAVVLSSRDKIQSAWKAWASGQPRLSPPVGLTSEDNLVPSPLMTPWKLFVTAPEWPSELRTRVDKLNASISEIMQRLGFTDGPLRAYVEGVGRVEWGGACEQIADKVRSAISGALGELKSLVRQAEEEGASNGRAQALLNNARDEARRIASDVQEPRFCRCFLVSGGYGSGKSYFIDAVVREAVNSSEPIAVPLFPKWHLEGQSVERAILDEVGNVFGVTDAKTLRDVETSFAKANVRLVVVVEDLQDRSSVQGASLKDILLFVRKNSRLGGVYWLFTLNDTSYYKIARTSEVWVRYAYEWQDGKDWQHSGWLQLDDINSAVGLSASLVSAYHPVRLDFEAINSLAHKLAMRYLSSPLITLLAMCVAGRGGGALVGADYYEVLKEYWGFLLRDDEGAENHFVREAAVGLAGILRRQRVFAISRAEADEVFAALRWSEGLSFFWKHSLVRLVGCASPASMGSVDPPMVYVLCEVVWAYYLASVIEGGWWNGEGPTRSVVFTSFLEECCKYESEAFRDLVAQHTLLMADGRGRPKYQAAVDHIWRRCQASSPLAPAVYFAAAKSSERRKRLVHKRLRDEPASRQNTRPREAHEVFAVMYFLSCCGEIPVSECLAALRSWSSIKSQPYLWIAEHGLGDCFWLLLRRRLDAVQSLSECVECFLRLANSHVTGVAGKIATEMWRKCYEVADVSREGVQRLIAAVEDYLIADNGGCREENSRLRPPNLGGEPYYFREHLLGHACGCFIRDWRQPSATPQSRGRRLLSLFDTLHDRGWFGYGGNARKIDQRIARQVRVRWALQCGFWYRRDGVSPEDKGEYQSLVSHVTGRGESWALELAFFMVRSTGTAGENGCRVADACFSSVLDKIKSEIPRLFEEYPIRCRPHRSDDSDWLVATN